MPQPELNPPYIHRVVVPLPFPVAPLNVYFIQEPVPTLIDTPPKGHSFLKLLNQELNTLGCSVADIKRIILTHPHFDHYGLTCDIVEKSGAEVYASSGTQQSFHAKAIEEDERFHQDLMLRAGAPIEWIQYVGQKFGAWAKLYSCELTVSQYLEEGSMVNLGAGESSIVRVPGHTPWCILVHDLENRSAFTGDFLLDHIVSNTIVQRPSIVPKSYGSLKALIGSLKKVRDLQLRIALPGHGRLIEDPNKRIDNILESISARKSVIYNIVRSRPKTLFNTVTKLFPRMYRHELFLAMSEVIGYLEVLEEEGRVVRKEGDALFFSVC